MLLNLRRSFMSGTSLAFEATPIVAAVKALYGAVQRVDDFVDGLIDRMKSSDSPAIERTGRVLEGAKYGFGIGYVIPIAIIAAGQYLLGNALGAATTLAGAVVLSNPVATTCAAIGAIYYGWQALSDAERNEILNKLQAGLSLGVELLRAVISYVVTTTGKLLKGENLRELRQAISDAASLFGRTLGDITRTVKDRAGDVMDAVSGGIESAAGKVEETVRKTVSRVKAPRKTPQIPEN
jgi:hypothetical protein